MKLKNHVFFTFFLINKTTLSKEENLDEHNLLKSCFEL